MNKNLDLGHWIDCTNADEIEHGFVYLITHKATGSKYIGKKQALTTRKNSKGRRVPCYTNFRKYCGSSKWLDAAMVKDGKDAFQFEILYWGKSKSEINYVEAYLILRFNAVLDYGFYNRAIKVHVGRNTIDFEDYLDRIKIAEQVIESTT